MNMTEYAAEKNVTVEVVDGPHFESVNDWQHVLFKVRLKANGKQMTTEWRQGMAHGDSVPSADEVLNAVVMDAGAYDNSRNLDDFLNEFGYEVNEPSDRVKFEKVYNACRKQAENARRVFGDDEFNTLLCEVERL